MRAPAAILAALLLAAPPAAAQAPKQIIVATGEVTGVYFPVGGAVCRMLGREADKHGLRCLVEPTAGNLANLAALRRGDADLAMVQSRALYQARIGEGNFAEQGAFPALRAIAAMHGEPLLVLVAKSAKIGRMADLKGRKVNLGRPQSFQRFMADAALTAAGLSAGDVQGLEIEFEQQAAALCDGRLDAAFFTGIHPMPAVQQVLQECEVEPLDLKPEVVKEAIARRPYLAPQVVPADTYPAVDRDIATISMKAVLTATEKLPAETAELLARTLAGGLPAMVTLHPVLRGLTRDGIAKDGIAVPLHGGAEKYYREAGILK